MVYIVVEKAEKRKSPTARGWWKQENAGKKMSNEYDRITGDKAKASLRNVVQGGITNKNKGGMSITKKA
ncbi:hypothetical protein ACOSQ4_017598 [Xanthoceras sorbifolium]